MAPIYKIMIFAMLILASCKDNHQVIDNGLASFSEIQCHAVKLNEKRFELFDQIRILESDTITNNRAIDSLKNVAENVKNQSLQYADTLKTKLSDFMDSHKLSADDRKYFDKKLNEIVAKCKTDK